MVKNSLGGSKGKSFARKLTSSYSSSIRLPTNELEQFACVIRLLGNGRVLIRLLNGKEMQAFIRNKFRGRSKRNHLITVGTFVLVGFHEWEAPNFKHTDVLTVYSYEEVLYLKSLPQYNLASLDAELYNLNSSSKPSGSGGVGGVGGASAAGADIEFTNEDYELPPNKAAVMDGEMNCGGGPGAAADMDEDFDFDAI